MRFRCSYLGWRKGIEVVSYILQKRITPDLHRVVVLFPTIQTQVTAQTLGKICSVRIRMKAETSFGKLAGVANSNQLDVSRTPEP